MCLIVLWPSYTQLFLIAASPSSFRFYLSYSPPVRFEHVIPILHVKEEELRKKKKVETLDAIPTVKNLSV